MRHSFSLHRATGHLNRAGGFALTGRQFFQHRLTGAHELPQAGSPLTGGSFSAPADRGTRTAAGRFALTGRLLFCTDPAGGARTASACSPLTGREFSAEPQRGDSPSADGGSVPRPAAGAKRKGHLRFPFLFELLPFPCFLIWRRFPICDRSEIRYGRGFFLPCFSQPVRRIRYRTATHMGNSTLGAA